MAGLKVITPPASEPVTKEQVLFQLRYDDPDPETIAKVEELITAAREWCEDYQNRAYLTQTIELALDRWPCDYIELKKPPSQSVVSLTYTDHEGNDTVWDASNYIVDDYAFVPYIVRKTNWPHVQLAKVNGVKVRYVAGYESASDVPEKVKQAVILLAAYWFDNGLCDPPPAVMSLLNMDRVVPV